MVGARGFEPPTPGPPDQCANRTAPRSDTHQLLKPGAKTYSLPAFAAKVKSISGYSADHNEPPHPC